MFFFNDVSAMVEDKHHLLGKCELVNGYSWSYGLRLNHNLEWESSRHFDWTLFNSYMKLPGNGDKLEYHSKDHCL